MTNAHDLECLHCRHLAGDKQATAHIMQAIEPIVFALYGQLFGSRKLDPADGEDLKQEGRMAGLKALRTWRKGGGKTLLAWVWWHVKRDMLRARRKQRASGLVGEGGEDVHMRPYVEQQESACNEDDDPEEAWLRASGMDTGIARDAIGAFLSHDLPEGVDTGTSLDRSRLLQAMRRALGHRALILDLHLAGFTVLEIAADVGVSRQTVARRLRDAAAAGRKFLATERASQRTAREEVS